MACPYARSSSGPLARGDGELISEFLWEPLPLAWLPGLSLEAQKSKSSPTWKDRKVLGKEQGAGGTTSPE